MGRTAYWNRAAGRLASWALGDASRGALYLALRPAASNGESPSPPPPERRAPSDSLEISRESAGAFGAAKAAQRPEREEQHETERRPVGEADLRRLAGDEPARRLEHARHRIHRRDRVDPPLQQRERHVHGREEEHEED